MKEYILEKVNNTSKYFTFGNIDVHVRDEMSNGLDPKRVLITIEKVLPRVFFRNLKKIHIGEFDHFKDRSVNAMYSDSELFISNQQDNYRDLINDVVHEIAHHIETQFIEEVYGDETIKKEFLKKRKQLEFELRSEGLWTNNYDFENIKFDRNFDDFLYKRVGYKLLTMATTGIFIRPYASVSLREYFATGFEAYYIGERDALSSISPALYEKVKELSDL